MKTQNIVWDDIMNLGYGCKLCNQRKGNSGATGLSIRQPAPNQKFHLMRWDRRGGTRTLCSGGGGW